MEGRIFFFSCQFLNVNCSADFSRKSVWVDVSESEEMALLLHACDESSWYQRRNLEVNRHLMTGLRT